MLNRNIGAYMDNIAQYESLLYRSLGADLNNHSIWKAWYPSDNTETIAHMHIRVRANMEVSS